MGCGGSKEGGEQVVESAKIDKQLASEKEKMAREVKMLLLGAGDSGKSTIVKQMKIIHENGYTKEDREAFKSVVFNNATQAMQSILNALPNLDLKIEDDLQNEATLVAESKEFRDGDPFPPGLGVALKKLWQCDVVKNAFTRKHEYQVDDSAPYFLESIDRFADPSYLPSDQDILHSRVKTTGIIETRFSYKDLNFRLFDVGGQRSERKKWIHCFEDVTTIIFCVAISGYDQMLHEDETTNRLHESLTLFDSICNSKWFINTSMILFLNKVDLFKEKIGTSPLTRCFPEYSGDSSFEQTSAYIRQKFEALNKNPSGKTIYTHFTCATDTENVKFVFAAITNIIIQKNLESIGIY